jgi:hypothetical protein
MLPKHCRISALFLAVSLLVLLAAQPALADTLRQQIASDGKAMCNALGSMGPGGGTGETSEKITGADAEAACKTLQNKLANASGWPTVWQMSQIVAATLDVGLQGPSLSVRQQYAQDVHAVFSSSGPYSYGYQETVAAGGSSGGCQAINWSPFCSGLTPNGGGSAKGGDETPFMTDSSGNPGPGVEYYDDNAWVGSDLIQAYHQAYDTSQSGGGSLAQLLLAQAQNLYQHFEQSGLWQSEDASGGSWSPLGYSGEPSHVDPNGKPGPSAGVFFNTLRLNRGAVVNADAAMFATNISGADSDQLGEKAWAADPYSFVQDWLGQLDQTTNGYTYSDHLKPDGCRSGNGADDGSSPPSTCAAPQSAQSYAYGLMIGDDGNLGHPTQAQNDASAANNYFFNDFSQPSNNNYPDLEAECPAFDAVYFHYLWNLDKDTDPSTEWNDTYYQDNPRVHNYVVWIREQMDSNWSFTSPWPFIGQTQIGQGAACGGLLPDAGAVRALIDDITHK